MKGIDIGINLINRQYNKNRLEVIENSLKDDIGVIITGCTEYSNEKSIEFLRQYNDLFIEKYGFGAYCTIGIHPHNAKDYNNDFIEKYIDMLGRNHNFICAIGEIGLDFDRMYSTEIKQIEVFSNMIEVARKYDMPMFLHERSAVDKFYDILSQNKDMAAKSVVHCFTGTKDTVKRYLDLGCMIGITGWICDNRRNNDLIEAVKYIPFDRFMVETDGPYLTPPQEKNRINIPQNITYVWDMIGKILNQDEELIREKSLENTKKFFNIY